MVELWRGASRGMRIVLIASVLIGLVERIGWAIARKVPYATGEAGNVAVAVGRGRGFADAFWAGQGPTAHLLPVAPGIAGAVYAVLGVRTPAAEAVLLGWSLSVTFAAYALVCAAMRRVGVSARACLWAFAMLSAVSVYTTNEAFQWRVWEGGLGLTLAAASLLVLLRAEDGAPPRRFGFWRAALPAATFFVNPAMGVTAFAGWALFTWRHRAAGGIVRPTLAAVVALAVLVAPWTVRNAIVMGRPIPLRDDLGMEIAVGNYPEAVRTANPDEVFLARLTAIQPYVHPPAQRALIAAGGEIEYSRLLGRRATAWMRAHPGEVAVLWFRHFREMLFTDDWMFRTTNSGRMSAVRATIVRVAASLALIGLALAARRRAGRYLYAAAYLAVPVLLYLPFQPVQRYTWLIWPTIACLAMDAIARAAARMAGGGGARPYPSSSSSS